VSGVEGEMWTRLSRIVEREPGAERDRSHTPRVPRQVATPWGYTELGTPKEGVATCLGTT
jgi:hypothetical protein